MNIFDFKVKDKNGNERKAFHLHSFRKFARSNLPPELPVDMCEQILGHSGYLTDEYRKYDDLTLGKHYEKAMSKVTIFETSPDLSEINESMKEKEDRIKELEETMHIMKMKMDIIENKYELEKIKNGKS